MRIFEGSEAVGSAARGCVLTVGNFDGLHLGHRELLARVAARARALGKATALYTFEPHPRRVLFPERAQPRLMTSAQLEQELERSGLELLIRERFTADFAALSPEKFLRDVLAQRIAPTVIFVGRDFHFGKGREGSGETLAARAPELGIEIEIVPQVRAGAADVSSTRVREALARGDVVEAALCLGRPYSVWGSVVLGDQRGRTLGFPTANLASENELVPAHGVYATRVRLHDGLRWGEVDHPAVTNVGTRPTFEPGRVLVETHLLDWSGDLYGRRMALAFHARVRDERRFSGPAELAAQIARDAESARGLLATGSA